MGRSPFVLASIHQVMENGWVVWEEGKYVSVSRRRFENVDAAGPGLRVRLRGAVGETVKLVALQPRSAEAVAEWTVVRVNAVIGEGGSTAIVLV